MNFLVIAATEAEIAPLIKHIHTSGKEVEDGVFAIGDKRVKTLITGAGLVATTYNLTKELQKNTYDLVLQAGIAGSFNSSLKTRDVVFVQTEQLGDMGADAGDEFIDVFELNLAQPDEMPFSKSKLINELDTQRYNIDLPAVTGLTVNRTSGKEETIAQLIKKYNCDIESMEGAPLHYVCLSERVNFAQIRAISNPIERRNKENWDIKGAIEALNNWLLEYFCN
ncbi:MAG: futalosine hydrolase [Chitinophagales bacterium]|nr:futalosine hydrolase [Chitinophagaceae bacterium]MCB9063854.1 futalosine hydrolase [Chitinophagales bacterium]